MLNGVYNASMRSGEWWLARVWVQRISVLLADFLRLNPTHKWMSRNLEVTMFRITKILLSTRIAIWHRRLEARKVSYDSNPPKNVGRCLEIAIGISHRRRWAIEVRTLLCGDYRLYNKVGAIC